MEQFVQSGTYGIVCTVWNIWNSLYSLEHMESFVQSVTYGIVCTVWNIMESFVQSGTYGIVCTVCNIWNTLQSTTIHHATNNHYSPDFAQSFLWLHKLNDCEKRGMPILLKYFIVLFLRKKDSPALNCADA